MLILYDASGFALALGPTDEPIVLPPFFHFGTGSRPARTTCARSATASRRTALEIVDWWDEPDYVSVKFRDPDGYVIEVGWEPE